MTNEQKELVKMSAEIMAKTMTMDTLLDELVKLANMLGNYDFTDEKYARCKIAIGVVKAEIKSRVKESYNEI